MTDRMMAILALAVLGLFIAVVPAFVPEPDLIILAVLCFGLAGYDFWRELFRNGRGS